MGRKPHVNTNLPPRMRARKQRSGRVFYYYDTGRRPRKEIPLGPDFVLAVRKWSELEQERAPATVATVDFNYVRQRYMREALSRKAPRTQRDNLKELDVLQEYFDGAPIDEIRPTHIRMYMTWREEKSKAWYLANGRTVPTSAGHVRANREIALFSHLFNFAREVGLTDAPNPCLGIRKNKETGRDVYVEDDAYAKVWAAADQPVRDAMDLAYLTGQRPADTLRFNEADIRNGALHITQGKTAKKLRISVVGELAKLILEVRARKVARQATTDALVVTEGGIRLSYDALRQRFRKAREMAGVPAASFQFRDIRAKAGTDKTDLAGGDIRQAQRQLGHRTIAMTEHYVRQRKGEEVTPTK